ncbi:MAG: aldose epimerase family protein [Pirellulaceae bacterium]
MSSARAAEALGPVPFGKTADGTPVELFTLKNDDGMYVTIMTRGATIVELHQPDQDGKLADVVLGFDDVQGYESEGNQYFGCVCGRVCNRIAKGKFKLDGKEYTLAVNNEPNHLHGGVKRSLDRVVWKGKRIDDGTEQNSDKGIVQFTYTSPDGDEGYPGKASFTVTYTLDDDNRLRLDYVVETDAPTPINVTNHTYFNLHGEGTKTVLDHELQVFADEYTPTDENLIPTGKIAPVKGTPLDFRQPHKIGERIKALVDTPTIGYDHNFVLSEKLTKVSKKGTKKSSGGLKLAAKLRDPESGRQLTVRTTEPGVQVYTGNFMKGQKGKKGKPYPQRSAVCLETQHFPDAVNQPNFPSIIVKPGMPYKSTTVFEFNATKPSAAK